tara:strand:+ start:50 stop:274 length:225 start_codon:yes stop_codon:yes gene_type:complete
MNPKDKARELVVFYIEESVNSNLLTTKEYDIKCALFCVNQILVSLYDIEFYKKEHAIKTAKYWKEVKQELNKLL